MCCLLCDPLTTVVWNSPPPLPYLGTVLYNILDAQDPHRFKISTEGPGMGWSIVQRLWVFPADLVREAVAMSPSRVRAFPSNTREEEVFGAGGGVSWVTPAD